MNKSFITFLMLFATSPSWALTVSGTILDDNNEPLIYATVLDTSTGRGDVADENGNYSIDVSSYDTQLKFSYVSHIPLTTQAGRLIDDGTVILNWNTNIPEIDVLPEDTNDICTTHPKCTSETTPMLPPNASAAYMECDANNQPYCKIETCLGFAKVSDDNKQCISVLGDACTVANDSNASSDGTYVRVGNDKQCKPNSCIHETHHIEQQTDGSFKCVFDNNLRNRENSDCTAEELKSLMLEHATAGTVDGYNINTNGTVTVTKCIITKCENGWSPNLNGTQCIEKNCTCGTEWNDETRTCVKWETDSCTALNATKTIRLCVDGHDFCAIQECADNYYLNTDKNVCVSVNGKPCDNKDANAELATYDANGKCIIRSCKPGFDINKTTEQCVAREKANIDALQESTDITTANEQSMGNKLKTAVGMGATGIGGMMIGSGMAEQFADDDAYADMRAYIETFRCDYGSGQAARGGDTNVDLPGGNELTDAYTQYATLANDLKIRKQALNIRPGIESEVIIDKADSGLYDNAGTGITSGGYASIARAILNPGGSDSEKLETQNNNSADKLEVGTGLAGAGIAGSILINKSQK